MLGEGHRRVSKAEIFKSFGPRHTHPHIHTIYSS